MNGLKKNVTVYNTDVECYGGYEYSTNKKFSSIVANRRITATIIENIGPDIKTVIDIGCGDGTNTLEIKKGKQTITIWGTDPAVEAIERAGKLYPEIDFFISNILEKDSLPDKHYDLAILNGVIHHVADQQLALSNVASLADYMLLVEPNGNNPILKIIERISKYHIEHEEQSFAPPTIINWCRQAGWKVIRLKYIGFVPFFFPTFPAKIIYCIQPVLEKIPLICRYFSAQVVIFLKKA